MTLTVKDLPSQERPREKLLILGAKSLSNIELLAILLRSGVRKKSALQIAQELLITYKEEGLSSLVNMSPKEFTQINGIGPAKIATLLAGIELGLRLAKSPTNKKIVIKTPKDVADYVMPKLRYEKQEHFAVLLLDTKNQVITYCDITVGSLNASIVHPREVFRCAISHSASSIILVHNHPSGDPTPSIEDINVTKKLVKSGQIIDIEILDHVIIGDNKYTSLKEQCMLE